MVVLLSIAVFATAVVLDYADTSNTRAVAEGRAHAAARWSVVMYVLSCVGFLSIIKISWWFAVPEVLGLYVGTVVAVIRLVKKSKVIQTYDGGTCLRERYIGKKLGLNALHANVTSRQSEQVTKTSYECPDTYSTKMPRTKTGSTR